MNDFDRLLEIQLRLLLDRVVTTPAPIRRRLLKVRADETSVAIRLPVSQELVAVPVEVYF
jgi:hypothetical protein